MQLTHSIALDFGRDTLPITIFAKQYDKESRFVEIVPLECGKDYTLESGVTARLQLTKPDGHTVLGNDCKRRYQSRTHGANARRRGYCRCGNRALQG